MHDKTLRTSDDIDEVLCRYSDMVYKIAFSHTGKKEDADDIFQNVFLRYISGRKQFESEEHKKAYLIRATINQAKSIFRSAWFRKTKPIEENIVFETNEDSDLYSVVLKLPLKYRTVIQLYYYEDLSIKQISTAINMKESTVKSQLHRARALLRDHLKGDYEDVW